MATEIYTSLEGNPGAIRLLQVFPGDYDDVLDCHLYEATLGPSLSYTALSYVWENRIYDKLGNLTSDASEQRFPILCDGKRVEIGANLNSALRQLRDQNKIIHLWVDKLCIDQGDITERNHQVALMRRIYEGSQEVVIWLGDRPWDEDPDDCNSAFVMIRQFARGEHIIRNGVFSSDLHALGYGTSSFGNISKLEKMMAVSWWRRIWVVQETVVSMNPTVRYGDMSLPWATFIRAAANLASEMSSHPTDGFGEHEINAIRDAPVDFSRTVLQLEKTRTEWMSGQPATLLALLRKFRSRESSDKRDKVFALVGLVTSWQRVNPLVPDYALSVGEVLWQSTVKIIASEQSLSVLEGTLLDCEGKPSSLQTSQSSRMISSPDLVDQAGIPGFAGCAPVEQYSVNILEQNPSWVVDWTIPPMSRETERLSHLELFGASAGSTGLVQLHGKSVLEVQGFFCDEIVATGEVMPHSGFGRMRITVEKWLEIAFHPKDHMTARVKFSEGKIRKGTQLEAFATSICGGIIYDPSDQAEVLLNRRSYRRVDIIDLATFRDWSNPDRHSHRRVTIVDRTLQRWTDVELNKKTNSLQFAIETSSSGRRFFVSRGGYMGIGPQGVQIGDHICVVLGSRVPLILRPMVKEEKCHKEKLRVLIRDPNRSKNVKECSDVHQQLYTVVGDAYVHGTMDGEIVDSAQKHGEMPQPLYLV